MPSLVDAYLARTRGSAALFERASRSLPGGSTRTAIFSAPYPPYMVRGEGIRTWDVDGNEYRDFLGNSTSLILGHAHPEVVAAVQAQVRRGSAFAAPTETEIELAEEIRGRLPSIERLRFTNSGTEATMFAIRAARAFTGRDVLAKFENAYHGTRLPPGTPRDGCHRDAGDGSRHRRSHRVGRRAAWGDAGGARSLKARGTQRAGFDSMIDLALAIARRVPLRRFHSTTGASQPSRRGRRSSSVFVCVQSVPPPRAS